MEESFQRLLRGLYLAVIFMFLLLVAQFRSLIEPFNMIFSLSLILTGILGGLLLADQTFSTVSILAVVILTGMMMTVAVLMIDLVLRLRAEGHGAGPGDPDGRSDPPPAHPHDLVHQHRGADPGGLLPAHGHRRLRAPGHRGHRRTRPWARCWRSSWCLCCTPTPTT